MAGLIRSVHDGDVLMTGRVSQWDLLHARTWRVDVTPGIDLGGRRREFDLGFVGIIGDRR